jgi:hypothetical protein
MTTYSVEDRDETAVAVGSTEWIKAHLARMDESGSTAAEQLLSGSALS